MTALQQELCDLLESIEDTPLSAQPPLGEVRHVDGAIQPPGAVVVPEMVVGSRGLLTAGNDGRCDLIHGDVVVWIHDIAMPGKTKRPS